MQIYAKQCIRHATEKYINIYLLAYAYIMSKKQARSDKILLQQKN